MDLRSRGNSSLEVTVVSRPASTNKVSRNASKLGLDSQTKYLAGAPRPMKASRVFGTELNTTTDSFDSPVQLNDVHPDGIRRDVKSFVAGDTDEHDEHGGIRVEVDKRIM